MQTNPRVTLHQGDCLDLLPQLAARSVDLVLCDLPYGITDCPWDRTIDEVKLWSEYRRILKPKGVIALFAQQPFATVLAAAAPKRWLRYDWIWDKVFVTGFGNAKRRPMRRHENILVFSPVAPAYRPSGLKICARTKLRLSGTAVYRGFKQGPNVTRRTGYPQSILRYPSRVPGEMVAPCMKPVALLEFLIRTYTRPRAVVLDNAMGLGSTGVAAVKTGRSFIGMEIDPERFNAARERILRKES